MEVSVIKFHHKREKCISFSDESFTVESRISVIDEVHTEFCRVVMTLHINQQYLVYVRSSSSISILSVVTDSGMKHVSSPVVKCIKH